MASMHNFHSILTDAQPIKQTQYKQNTHTCTKYIYTHTRTKTVHFIYIIVSWASITWGSLHRQICRPSEAAQKSNPKFTSARWGRASLKLLRHSGAGKVEHLTGTVVRCSAWSSSLHLIDAWSNRFHHPRSQLHALVQRSLLPRPRACDSNN